MKKTSSGFTIVELLIVIGIIGILATIGIVTFSRIQSDTRDNERASKATVITEALEKYYDANGEYPSCASLTADPSTVSTEVLPGIDEEVLRTPKGQTGELNSIKCLDIEQSTTEDYFAYIGDNDPNCTGPGGTACVLYQLKYKEESTGEIVTLDSRRKTGLSSTAVPAITATATSFSQINTSWSSIEGATSYDLQWSTTSTFPDFSTDPNKASVTSASRSVTDLSYNTKYYFRVRAVNAISTGGWSATSEATTRMLAQPTCSVVANSPFQLTVSWNTITYASTYTVEYDDSSDFSSPTTSTGNTGTSKAITGLNPNDTLYFRVRAVNGAYASNWCNTVNATTIEPIPTGLALTVNSTIQITANWSAVDSADSYEIDYSTSSSFSSFTTLTSATTSKAITGLNQNTTYYVRVRSVIGSYISPSSSTVSAKTPTVVLSGPVECAGTYSGRTTFQVRLWLNEVSYNLSANTSNVSWSLYRIRASSPIYYSYDQTKTWPWAVSINGSNWSGASNSIVFKTNGAIGATEGISSGSLTVAHNSDGRKTISYAGSDGPGSTIFGSASCSSSYVLSDLR